MKQIIFVALMTLITGSAFAHPTICSENVDHGYSINFSPDMSSAEVVLTTFTDSKVVANLNCSQASVAPPSKPGRIFVLASCYEPNIADAGYSIVVRQNSGNGVTTATLSEVTFVGSNPVAELACQ